MVGDLKRKYNHEMQVISSDIYKRVKKLLSAMPVEYNLVSIISYYKKYYPIDFNHYIEMINNYKKKNDF